MPIEHIAFDEVPALCDQILAEIESSGTIFDFYKDGKPHVRIMPVFDESDEK